MRKGIREGEREYSTARWAGSVESRKLQRRLFPRLQSFRYAENSTSFSFDRSKLSFHEYPDRGDVTGLIFFFCELIFVANDVRMSVSDIADLADIAKLLQGVHRLAECDITHIKRLGVVLCPRNPTTG